MAQSIPINYMRAFVGQLVLSVMVVALRDTVSGSNHAEMHVACNGDISTNTFLDNICHVTAHD